MYTTAMHVHVHVYMCTDSHCLCCHKDLLGGIKKFCLRMCTYQATPPLGSVANIIQLPEHYCIVCTCEANSVEALAERL